MHSLQVDSPAKINLSLYVLRRRSDGYHEICTLFHRISLRDTLRLRKRSEGIRLVCSHPRVPKKENLIARAFHLLKASHPFSGGVTCHLTKRIPVGGGLGGGSSNAASFLLGMNRLYRLGLTPKELARLGRELGADIPFFLSGAGHAVGEGRGDRVRPLPFRRRLGFILFPDTRGLRTQRVYQGLGLKRGAGFLTRGNRSVRLASAFLAKGDLTQASKFLVNDLAPSAERIRPSLKKRRRILSELQLGTCQMSGSGPTLFLIFPSYAEAQRAFRQLGRHSLSKAAILCHSD